MLQHHCGHNSDTNNHCGVNTGVNVRVNNHSDTNTGSSLEIDVCRVCAERSEGCDVCRVSIS